MREPTAIAQQREREGRRGRRFAMREPAAIAHQRDARRATCEGRRPQSRNARIGSIRAARQAGTKHAAIAAIAITMSAEANDSGSRGLTL
jgi:hypothetical protein